MYSTLTPALEPTHLDAERASIQGFESIGTAVIVHKISVALASRLAGLSIGSRASSLFVIAAWIVLSMGEIHGGEAMNSWTSLFSRPNMLVLTLPWSQPAGEVMIWLKSFPRIQHVEAKTRQ